MHRENVASRSERTRGLSHRADRGEHRLQVSLYRWQPKAGLARAPASDVDYEFVLLNNGDSAPFTQKVIFAILGYPRGSQRRVGRRRTQTVQRNAVSNDEGVIADQDVFDDEPHDSLPFHDIERVGRVSQSCQKSCESLG